MNTENLASHDLNVSLTRERVLLFVPYKLAVLLGTLMFLIGVHFHTWKIIFVIPAVWAAAAILVKDDLNAFRVFLVNLRLLGIWLDAWRWGGPSASPRPCRPSTPRARGMF